MTMKQKMISQPQKIAVCRVVLLSVAGLDRLLEGEDAIQKKLWPPDGTPSEPWVLISISSDREGEREGRFDAEFRLNSANKKILTDLQCVEALPLHFSDILEKHYLQHKAFYDSRGTYFNVDHLTQAINFVDRIKFSASMLVVNCGFGRSRSGAIGLFFAKYLDLDIGFFLRENIEKISPNPSILYTCDQKIPLFGFRSHRDATRLANNIWKTKHRLQPNALERLISLVKASRKPKISG